MEGSTHEWVLEQREALRAVAVEASLRRAEAFHEDDRYDDAIASSRHASRIGPWNESAARLEMTLSRKDAARLVAFGRRKRCRYDLRNARYRTRARIFSDVEYNDYATTIEYNDYVF